MALPEYRDGPAGLGCWIPLLGVGFLRIGIRTFQGLRFRFSGLLDLVVLQDLDSVLGLRTIGPVFIGFWILVCYCLITL
jgi:hypothetical protein